MSVSTGEKKNLTISKCDATTLEIVESAPVFEAMINPASFKKSSKVHFGVIKSKGAGRAEKFSMVCPEEYSFQDIVLDGTGVVAVPTFRSVMDQLGCLREVAFTYNTGEIQTPVIKVSWGALLFYARLTKLAVNYTLFKPSGEPLRAKVNLDFLNYESTNEITAIAANNSADLTQLVKVKAGDTLPNLCYRIYKDASYCLTVANINKLSNFRCLQPGQVLRFPPLV